MEGNERYSGTILFDNRVFTGSPREVLRESFKAKLISDDAWMDMLKVRNELAHDYDCEVVRTHCNTIVEKYIDLFYDFKNTIDELLKVG